MRLVKFVASAGVASRRASEELIRAGRVAVNGETVTDPARDVSDADEVAVDGRAVEQPSERVVYALHKPLGVLSTARDPQRRPTVVSLVPEPGRLYPVGRLDADSSGLILLTNDGALAHRLTHPRFQVPKTYLALVRNGPVGDRALRALRAGIELDDGPTSPARVRRLGPDRIEITIREGRNRQVRRMCQAVGHPVWGLERVAFGPLRLGTLAPGDSRRLSPDEVTALASAGSEARRSGSSSSAEPRRPRAR
ncbi:MAG: rRNA pseudouridine synthase [Solirubrobacterales bacterium]|nr:rRNA pseudouridine synthase [Solirubrobacterales bacterium]